MHTNQPFSQNDPFEFVRNLWNGMGFTLPGMVTPTLDADELERRIADMKNVENWLRMNLGMLQMTIQGLEMQQATLNAVKAMSTASGTAAGSDDSAEAGSSAAGLNNPFMEAATAATAAAAMWPWNLMGGGAAATSNEPPAAASKDKSAAPKKAASQKRAAPTGSGQSRSTASRSQTTTAKNSRTQK